MRLKAGVPKTITLCALCFLLTGCAKAKPERKVQEMRDVYQSVECIDAQAKVTADYGQRLYHYTVTISGGIEAGKMSVLAPESIKGAALEWNAETTSLTYEDITLDTGALTKSGLSPADAIPALLKSCRAGTLIGCALEGEEGSQTLTAELENPEAPETSITCRYSADGYLLEKAEFWEEGVAVLTLDFDSCHLTLSGARE